MTSNVPKRGKARWCGCGCGESLKGKGPTAKFVDDTHRVRAHRMKVASAPAVAVVADGEDVPDYAESRARREAALAALAELELAAKRGEYVEAAEVAKKLADTFSSCRAKLLGVSTRCRQQLPHLARGDVETIDRLVREALEELADSGP
jgi:phage terminase Nu1 subunit (DNA packaging protein)